MTKTTKTTDRCHEEEHAECRHWFCPTCNEPTVVEWWLGWRRCEADDGCDWTEELPVDLTECDGN